MTAVLQTAFSAVLLSAANGVNLPLSWILQAVASCAVSVNTTATIGASNVEITATAAPKMASAPTAANLPSPTAKVIVSSAQEVPISINSKRNATPVHRIAVTARAMKSVSYVMLLLF